MQKMMILTSLIAEQGTNRHMDKHGKIWKTNMHRCSYRVINLGMMVRFVIGMTVGDGKYWKAEGMFRQVMEIMASMTLYLRDFLILPIHFLHEVFVFSDSAEGNSFGEVPRDSLAPG